MNALCERVRRVKLPDDIAVVSVHWGSNWGYDVPRAQVRCSHRLIESGVDVVHGREAGDHTVALHAIEAVGELRLRLGAPHTAARLLAATDRCRIDQAQPLDDHERDLKDQIIEETRATVGEVAFAVAWSEGTTCTLEEAISDALASSRPSQWDCCEITVVAAAVYPCAPYNAMVRHTPS